MSDNFIPLNQSTPIRNSWHQYRNQNQRGFQNNRCHGDQRRGQNTSPQWGNNSRNNSYRNDGNSFGQDKSNIDAYLHPSMLQDPWASLRQKYNKS